MPNVSIPFDSLSSNTHSCVRFVVSKMELGSDTADILHIFRTYDNELVADAPGVADDELIWKVGRATSAAPTYFKPMQISDDFFSDGGVSYNDPTELAYEEVLSKAGYYQRAISKETQREPLCLILSIGTGGTDHVRARPNNGTRENTGGSENNSARKAPRRQRSNLISRFKHLGEKLSRAATDTWRVDRAMRKKVYNQEWSYVRWHGGEDLARLKLDEWICERGSRLSI